MEFACHQKVSSQKHISWRKDESKIFAGLADTFIAWMAGDFVIHGVLLATDYAFLPKIFRESKDSEKYMHFMLFAHLLMAGVLG